MNNEQLGEVAYNAYCESRQWVSFKGDPLPHWKQQEEGLRKAWVAAAQAVWQQIRTDTARG